MHCSTGNYVTIHTMDGSLMHLRLIKNHHAKMPICMHLSLLLAHLLALLVSRAVQS
jgi:hypothetical protein